MERRRRLALHIRARSSQPAFQIKADGMNAPAAVCVCVCWARETETKEVTKHLQL